MALSILDGTQTATTLSTILSSGQHITAHTVVSLGTQAITDMRSAVSGSVVSVSSLPAISGTVTVGNISSLPDADGNRVSRNFVFGYNYATELPVAVAINGTSLSVTGAVTANVPLSVDGYTAVTGIRVTGCGSDGGLRVQGIDPASSGPANLEEGGKIPVFGTVTVGNTVTIAGTVTANPTGTQTIAGTVTVGALPTIGVYVVEAVQDGNGNTFGNDRDFPISGSVTASISNSVTIASLPAISGTVTANSSNGSLTTRFGSVTTANTAFATSAVTNANRKYLLIQNVTTASNVITVGIGFTPTTTQGIQLSSGAGLTFEGSYIPTGAVNLLSSVTASCFTILEA